MKIVCGSTVYAGGKKIGRVSGFRVSGHHDQVTDLLIRRKGESTGCRMLPFQQILSAEQKRLRSAVPEAGMEKLDQAECRQEWSRMRRWLEMLTQESAGKGQGDFGHFAVISDADRGAFSLPGDQPLEIEECGYGTVAYLSVDSQGYILQVGVRLFEDRNAVVTMRPEPKRMPEEIVRSVHSAFHLV